MSSPCENAYVAGSYVVVPCSGIVQAANVAPLVQAAPEMKRLLAQLLDSSTGGRYNDSSPLWGEVERLVSKIEGWQ